MEGPGHGISKAKVVLAGIVLAATVPVAGKPADQPFAAYSFAFPGPKASPTSPGLSGI